MIYAYALDHVGGGFTRVATIASGNAIVKGIYFDRDVGYLWAQCGAACGNQLGVLRHRHHRGFAHVREIQAPPPVRASEYDAQHRQRGPGHRAGVRMRA